MNKTLLLIFLLISSLGLSAQNSLLLSIHHKLGNADFAMNTGVKNNIGHDLVFTRVEYYISGISITHDGGTVTPINEHYMLVNATDTILENLGTYAINQVEAISFHVGVEYEKNHADPSLYPPEHPLAPKAPSMHWGWAGGYRFAAVEGNGGSNFDQLFQFHGLGDGNYYKTEIQLSATATNNVIHIELDGDYIRILDNISINSGNIDHSDAGDAQLSLYNFQQVVFSPSNAATNIQDLKAVNSFQVYPNPAQEGITKVLLDAEPGSNYELAIFDMLGRKVESNQALSHMGQVSVSFDQKGIFLFTLIKDGKALLSRKVVSL